MGKGWKWGSQGMGIEWDGEGQWRWISRSGMYGGSEMIPCLIVVKACTREKKCNVYNVG
jgi:hypothetical protein